LGRNPLPKLKLQKRFFTNLKQKVYFKMSQIPLTNFDIGPNGLKSPDQMAQEQVQTIRNSRRAQALIPIISIVLILLAVVLFFALSSSDLFPEFLGQLCGPGLCANNRFSGEKTCPTNSERVPFNPSIQTCNPPGGCQSSSEAPCLYYDPTLGTVCPGDRNYSGGTCPSGTSTSDCKCLSRVYCPNFATVYFVQKTVTTESTPVFETLVQETTWRDAFGLPRNDIPLSPKSFSDSTVISCGVQKAQLDNIWPSNTCLRGTLTYSERDDLYYCTYPPSDLNCPRGQIPVLKTDGSYACQADSAAEQFNVFR